MTAAALGMTAAARRCAYWYTEPRMARHDFNFSFTLRVRWSECDVQGVVFNVAYANYVDIGQAEYFRNLGIAIYDPEVRRFFDFATVKMSIDFFAPGRLDDVLRVYWKIHHIGNSSLTARSEIFRGCEDEPLARAEVVYVNYDDASRASRPVSDGLRLLVNTFEATDEIIPLHELPDLSALTTPRPRAGGA